MYIFFLNRRRVCAKNTGDEGEHEYQDGWASRSRRAAGAVYSADAQGGAALAPGGVDPPDDAARPGTPPRRRVTRQRHRGAAALVPLPRLSPLRRIWLAILNCLRDGADFARITRELGETAVAQRVRYVQVTFVPLTHQRYKGMPYDEVWDGIREGEPGSSASWVCG